MCLAQVHDIEQVLGICKLLLGNAWQMFTFLPCFAVVNSVYLDSKDSLRPALNPVSFMGVPLTNLKFFSFLYLNIETSNWNIQ